LLFYLAEMKRYKQKSRSNRGMAMLMVLFIVMAIAVISSGFIARSDAELASGRNYCLRNEVDYLAWSGLEHARALVASPENTDVLDTWSQTELQLEPGSRNYYDLTLHSRVETAAADPNDVSTYTYTVQSAAYRKSGSEVLARSLLTGTLFYDPNSTEAHYISVTRQ
jgi:type II secretory pathway component PulK